MCSPIAAVSAVSSIFQMQQQAAYANAVNAQSAKTQEQNMQNAADSFNYQAQAVNARVIEEREAAAAQLAEVNRQALQAAGTVRVEAGGQGGGSLEDAYNEMTRQHLAFRFGTGRSLDMSEAQARRQLMGLRAGRAAQELSGVYTPMQTPNFLASLGTIAAQTAVLNKQLS